ncbi:hypothetical protein OEV98_17590 [Caldibacillus lycopersici]|uniref:Uncharacterized protein n=1 Tax=Perspicuibacillus lycopersici TaxID=1325689 RepID=A0AAE3LPV3_9BACI|nr:hypothetical protein [Perspicuibacillus lycopersici]MCU9615341.1 hypothetical protein [Perspicuibacillus lycopersici]
MQEYYYGGQYKGQTKVSFYVEDGVERIVIRWLSQNKHTKLSFVGPNGQSSIGFSTTKDSTLFEGGYLHRTTIDEPEAGKWSVQAKSPKEQYILNVTFQSPVNEHLMMNLEKEDNIQLSFSGNEHYVMQDNITATVAVEFLDVKNKIIKKLSITKSRDTNTLTIPNLGAGIYNVTINIKGETKNGQIYNRTILDSIYLGNQ